MIEIRLSDPQSLAIWRMLIEVCHKEPKGWTLVGAQMVALHGFEYGLSRPRSTFDADILVDVRALQDGTRHLSRALADMGFEFAGVNTEGVGHRFQREDAVIDILAPDGVGERANLTTIPPARTVRVPGGSQALARTELVDLSLENQVAKIPRPNLLGAILLKARAVDVDDRPDHQRQDLAFLLSMVADPRALSRDLKPSERGWLRRRTELLDSGNRAWRGLPGAEAGYIAFQILADLHPTQQKP